MWSLVTEGKKYITVITRQFNPTLSLPIISVVTAGVGWVVVFITFRGVGVGDLVGRGVVVGAAVVGGTEREFGSIIQVEKYIFCTV